MPTPAGRLRLLLPAFRWLRTAFDLTGLVTPATVDLGEGAVFLTLRDDLDGIALIFDNVFGEDELRGRPGAVHDDERVVDRYDEGITWRGRRTRCLPRRATVGLHDAVPAFEAPIAEDQLGVVGIEVGEVFSVLPAKIVVVTR